MEQHVSGMSGASKLWLWHLGFGSLTLLAFLGTGMFLRQHRPELIAAGPTLRLLYRARHIHLLSASLMHLLAGALLGMQSKPHALSRVGSALLFAAVPTLFWAFVCEPPLGFGHSRGVLFGMIALLAGTVALVAGAFTELRARHLPR